MRFLASHGESTDRQDFANGPTTTVSAKAVYLSQTSSLTSALTISAFDLDLNVLVIAVLRLGVGRTAERS